MPEDVTYDASTDTSWLVTGKWDDLIIATRSELQLRRLNERFATTLEVGFLATLRMDVGAWRDDSFTKVVGYCARRQTARVAKSNNGTERMGDVCWLA